MVPSHACCPLVPCGALWSPVSGRGEQWCPLPHAAHSSLMSGSAQCMVLPATTGSHTEPDAPID